MSEPKKTNGTVADLKKAAVEQLSDAKPAAIVKNTFTFGELYSDKDTPQEFLVNDLIPDAEVFGLIGEDGIGKTQIMSQLAICIGMKMPYFLGLKLNAKHGNALVVGTEDSKKKFTKAISKIFDGLSSKFDPQKVGVSFTEGSNFDDLDSLIKEIEDNLKLKHYDLVIVDALMDCFTMIDGEVNSNSHASRILSKFQSLCNTYSCALGFIHHASKTKITEKHKEGKLFIVKNDALGAGRITSKARTVLALTHDARSVSNESTEYTNYLHAIKVNLQSRHYVKNAVKLIFNTATLLHDPDGLVDIDLFETSSPESEGRESKRVKPSEISVEDHKTNAMRAFAEHESLARKDLVKKLQKYYSVGANKIEEKGGYLPHLIDIGLVVNVNGMFRHGTPDFKTTIIMPNLSFDEPAVSQVEIKVPVISELQFPTDAPPVDEKDDDDLDEPF